MNPYEAPSADVSAQHFLLSLLPLAVILIGVVQILHLLRSVDGAREQWRQGERMLAWRPFRLRDLAFVLLPVLAANLLAGFLLHQGELPNGEEREISLVDMAVQFVTFQLLVVVAAVVLVARKGLRWGDAFGDPRKGPFSGFGYALRMMFALMPVMILIGLATQAVLKILNIPPESQAVLRLLLDQDQSWLLAAGLFFAVVGAPVSEEILFRGILLPALSKWMTTPSAVIVSSLVFALIHFSPQQMPALFVLSLLLSLSYLYTRRLETAIALHAMFNGIMITIAILAADAPR